jgi:hypothetical protein
MAIREMWTGTSGGGLWGPFEPGKQAAAVRMLALFLSGVAVGIAISWAYVRSLKATLRAYKTYVHERMSQKLDQELPAWKIGKRATRKEAEQK